MFFRLRKDNAFMRQYAIITYMMQIHIRYLETIRSFAKQNSANSHGVRSSDNLCDENEETHTHSDNLAE